MARPEHISRQADERLLKWLKMDAAGMKPGKISKATGADKTTIRRALQKLKREME